MRSTSLFLGAVLIITSFTLAACQADPASEPTPSSIAENFTTKTGIVQTAGKTFVLQSGSQNVTLESYDVDLTDYVGQTVTVTGKYSGDTLFVQSVETQQ